MWPWYMISRISHKTYSPCVTKYVQQSDFIDVIYGLLFNVKM